MLLTVPLQVRPIWLGVQVPDQARALGGRAAGGRHVRLVRHLLPRAGEPRPADGRAAGAARARERIEKLLGLDDPVPVQYARFLKQLVVDQSLGHSFATRQEVNDIIKAAAPVTASLVFGGVVIWLMIAFPIGILSALRPRTLLDRAAMVFVLIGVSAHPVWIGLLLSYLVGYKLGWTPLGGYCDMINPSTDCGGPAQWAHSLVLPWVTFALLYAALYVRDDPRERDGDDERGLRAHRAREGRSRVARDDAAHPAQRDAADRDHPRDGHRDPARRRHLHRVGVRPPGLGKTAVTSLEGFDLPTVQGIVVFSTLAIIALNLIVDLLYACDRPADQAQLALLRSPLALLERAHHASQERVQLPALALVQGGRDQLPPCAPGRRSPPPRASCPSRSARPGRRVGRRDRAAGGRGPPSRAGRAGSSSRRWRGRRSSRAHRPSAGTAGRPSAATHSTL